MKKVFIAAMMVAMSMGASAQTIQRQVVEEGGTGPFKSEVVGDASCTGFTVYRPQPEGGGSTEGCTASDSVC